MAYYQIQFFMVFSLFSSPVGASLLITRIKIYHKTSMNLYQKWQFNLSVKLQTSKLRLITWILGASRGKKIGTTHWKPEWKVLKKYDYIFYQLLDKVKQTDICNTEQIQTKPAYQCTCPTDISIQTLYTVLIWSTFGSNYSHEISWVWRNNLCTTGSSPTVWLDGDCKCSDN